jgi:hypothetical protein
MFSEIRNRTSVGDLFCDTSLAIRCWKTSHCPCIATMEVVSMKKAFLALLLLVGAVAMASVVSAQEPERLPNSSLLRKDVVGQRAAGSTAAVYDTTWVGASNANHYSASTNPNNIWTGAYAPNANVANRVVWDFDTFGFANGGAIDSLQGWIPMFITQTVRTNMFTDYLDFPWACVDYGNVLNSHLLTPNAKSRGITGVWHSDPGAAAGTRVFWAPISGSRSAWCGLRSHGDNTQMDLVTGNPYNQNCTDFARSVGAGPTAKQWPGYGKQWDQMLYRDLPAAAGQSLTIAFNYRTRMSLGFDAGASGGTARKGWYHGDPLANVPGNFYSGSTINVVDSFEVFVGVPVNDASCTLSDGTSPPVYDPQRRWFSEVLQIWNGTPYYEILTTAGTNPVATDTLGSVPFSTTIPASYVDAIAGHANNPEPGFVRLVFRVKTNSNGDDQNGFSGELGGRGAAIIDDVTYASGGGSPVNFGDFEALQQSGPGAIDNRFGVSGVDSKTNWRSTGKPTPLWFHARPVAGLPWQDLCGVVGAPTRICNMEGNVLDSGVEPTESIGIGTIDAYKNNIYGVVGPSIDMTTSTNPNAMGIDNSKVAGTDDYYMFFDIYTGDLDRATTGVWYFPGAAAYPNRQPNGVDTWGDIHNTPFIIFNPLPQCYTDFYGFRGNGILYTSNASGVPDSVRIFLSLYNYPARLGAISNPNPTLGCYFDNFGFAIVNKAGGTGNVGTLTSDIWQWFVDAFPVGSSFAPSNVFTAVSDLDTCGALVKGAINTSQQGSAAGLGGDRLIVLADTIIVSAPPIAGVPAASTGARVDMVFRILPGPGNYRRAVGDSVPRYIGGPIQAQKLLQRPDQTALVNSADANDHSFWASYMRTPGAYSSGNHHAGAWWDYLTWNSARADTQETNVFPSAPNANGIFQSTLHELDPHYAELGISRPRCFVIDTLNNSLGEANVQCGTAPAWLGVPAVAARAGWDGTTSTIEGTKIIPDGLLTPGSHVQYFWRKSSQNDATLGYTMDPDTETITPQPNGGDFDGHRWQEFSVLPDRYKSATYRGAGDACLLYADYNDRRGEERTWISVMDSIGGTRSNKYGAHNGWHAAAGVSLNSISNPNLPAQAFVYGQNGSAGTLFDMYGVRSAESGGSVGTRLGGRNTARVGGGKLLGHDAQTPPTSFMLKSLYRAIAVLSGDLTSTVLGPRTDQPENDLATLSDFLISSDGLGAGKPRAIYFNGQGFVESESATADHLAFLTGYPAVSLVDASYAALASNSSSCSDLTNTSLITPNADVFGVGLSCLYNQNSLASVLGRSTAASFYTNTGAGPYVASVYHAAVPSNSDENYTTLTDGFALSTLWGRYCSTSYGRLARTYDVMTRVFSNSCASWTAPIQIVNVPNAGNGGVYANYMKIGNSVMRAGSANVRFGVATSGRVRVRLYDVTGRLVRTLADKTYQGGQEYTAMWDGRDDSGSQVARGVYFARIDYASGAAINGRVVVLQ